MKVAAAQIDCQPGDLAVNLGKVRDFAGRAQEAGAELVVFPELSDTGYDLSAIRECARPWSEGAVPALRALAAELSLAIICGVSERVGEKIYNSQVLVAADGTIAGSYRKAHLFCVGLTNEGDCFSAGEKLSSARLGDFHLGFSICYDLRFPEVYRTLALDHEANVFVVSSAWPYPRLEHLRLLATARAVENQSYVVLANRVGTESGMTLCGSSAIIDPGGAILASASPDREELLLAELSREALQLVRERMTVFAHRRGELYRKRPG